MMDWIEDGLRRVRGARVVVFGDFCMDAYWDVEEGGAEVSIETGLAVRRVRSQRCSLGGAGNVAANLVDLGAAEVRAVGLIGDDLFGREMLRLMGERGIEAAGVVVSGGWQTMVYAKPCVVGLESNRIDFGAFNRVDEAAADALADRLGRAAGECDAVVLNQQVPAGVSSPTMIERINGVIERRPSRVFIADSRHRPGLYRGAMLKLNAREAAGLCGEAHPRQAGTPAPLEDSRRHAAQLHERTGRPVFVTRGAKGMIVAEVDGVAEVPGVPVDGPTDPVGAGDTAVASLAAVLGGGGDGRQAARLANLAAAVTVGKLRTTGTATPEEVRAAAAVVPHVER